MATLQELESALIKADAAGNTADAKVFADEIRRLRAAAPQDQAAAPAGLRPGTREYADWAAQRARAGATLPQVSEAPPEYTAPAAPTARSGNPVMDFLGSAASTANGIVNGIPIAGPMLTNLSDAIVGGASMLGGGDFDETVSRQRQNRETLGREYPMANLAGNVAGGIGTFVAGGAVPVTARALGMTGSVPAQIGNSFLSTQALGTADNMARGMSPVDAFTDSLGASGIAAIIPGVSAATRAGGRAVRDNVINPVRAAMNPENAATRAVGRAVAQDAATAPALTQSGEQAVQSVGADVINADRFGSAIRTLARTASNVSPQADNVLREVTDQRFMTQGPRAVSFLQRLMNGATDDLALQDALRTGAQQANKTAYDAARNSPAAHNIMTKPILELMQSGRFRSAIEAVSERGADRAAVTGRAAPQNPFVFGADGSITRNPNAKATPSLDFWDQVKRNLDSQIDVAQRGGDRSLFADLTQIKQKLVRELDAAVPQYANARRGAAAFFGAEDAIDAGRKAATSVRDVNEVRRGVAAMTDAEKEAFSVGYSSELIDRINATRDRVNVINNIFGSQEAREKVAIALGERRARELEAYVRAEQALQLLRDAVGGNSTTARQLIQAGVLPAAGFGAGWLGSGGDLGTASGLALLVSAGRAGAKAIGRATDERVMQRVAEMLTSGDPADLQRAIQNASISQRHMDALNAIMNGLTTTAKGAIVGSSAAMAN